MRHTACSASGSPLRPLFWLVWLGLAIAACGQPAPTSGSAWLGAWSADVPGCGSIAVNITARDQAGPPKVELWWLFYDVTPATELSRLAQSGAPRFEGDTLFLQRLDHSTQNSAPGVAFRMVSPDEMRLVPYGVLSPVMPPVWANLVLKKDASRKTWFDRHELSRKLNGGRISGRNGDTMVLPPTWPADVVMPTALLFSYHSGLFADCLEASSVPLEFLRTACDLALSPSAWGSFRDETFAALAKNPRTPPDVLEKIWARSDLLRVWYLVASHPNARPEWRAAIVDRVMSDDRLRETAAIIEVGPDELFRRLLSDSVQTRRRLAGNVAAPAFVFEALARDHLQETGDILARNPGVDPRLLDALARSGSRERKFWMLLNKSLLPETRAWLIGDLIATATVKDYERLAGQEGAPVDFLIKCASDPDPMVRIAVARNPGTDQATLQRLTEDESVGVMRNARDQMKKRFPAVALAESPLPAPRVPEDLGPSLAEQYRKAIASGDMSKLRKLTDYLQAKGKLVATLQATAPEVVNQYRPEIMDLFLEKGFTNDDNRVTFLAGISAHDGRWLAYFKQHGFLEGNLGGEALSGALHGGTNDDLAALLAAGVDPNLRNFQYRTPLHQAVILRNPAAIEILLKAGAQPALADSTKSTPLAWAVRLMCPAAVRLLDQQGIYRDRIEAFVRSFPAAPDSPFVGTWVNLYPMSYRKIELSLSADGAGRLRGMFTPHAVMGWRSIGTNEAVGFELTPDGTFAKEPAYRFKFKTTGKVSSIDVFLPGDTEPQRLVHGVVSEE